MTMLAGVIMFLHNQRMRFAAFFALFLLCRSLAAQVGSGPLGTFVPPSLPEPKDRTIRGFIQLSVDATDTSRSIFRITERVPLQAAGQLILLYPEWETTSHAPTASVLRVHCLNVLRPRQ